MAGKTSLYLKLKLLLVMQDYNQYAQVWGANLYGHDPNSSQAEGTV